MTAAYSPDLMISVAGTPLSAEIRTHFVEGYVEDSASVPDLAVLRFRDQQGTLLSSAGIRIGVKLRIAVKGSDPVEQVVTVVEVVAVGRERDAMGTFTVVSGLDASHRLQRGTRSRVFVDKSAADIVREVAGDVSLPVQVGLTDCEVRPHVTQAGVSDWELLRRLAAEEGAVLSVIEGTLHFDAVPSSSGAPPVAAGPAATPRTIRLTDDVLVGRAQLTSLALVDQVEVRGWSATDKQALASVESSTATAEFSAGLSPGEAGSPFGSHTLLITQSWSASASATSRRAKAAAADIAAAVADIQVEVRGDPELRAGVAVRLDKFGQPFDGTYAVTATRHLFDATVGYRTEVSITARQDRSLAAVLGGGRGAGHPGDRLVTGIVTNTKDPDHQGRVKVSLPWLGDQMESTWARTLQFGGTGGGMILPEIGDEVLVGFEFGDVDRPYVLGGLYNGRDAPSDHDVRFVDANDGKIVNRAMISRSGHRLELLDPSSGSTGVRLATGDKAAVILLDATETRISVTSDGEVLVRGAKGITLDSGSGDVTIKGANVTVDAQQKIAVSGTSGATVSAGSSQLDLAAGAATLKGTAVAVQGQATAELSGSTSTTVRGGIVRIN